MPDVKCKICLKSFYAKPSWIKKGWGKYCSKVCQFRGQLKGKYKICHICENKTWRTPKDINSSKSGKFFCTKSCQTIWRNKQYTGHKHPNWRGGEFTYQRIMAEHKIKPICKHCGFKNKKALVIHHKDNNRKNNIINNLIWLCRNCHYLAHDGKTF